MQNIKLVVAYDGTAYLGWQRTSMGPSIESTLQSVLEQILQHPLSLQAASRTDAGVHAKGQVVNFLTSKEQVDPFRLIASLNALLPKDITVLESSLMPSTFHPTLDCDQKEYRYYMCDGMTQLPHHRLYSWHYPYSLQIEEMRKSTRFLVGFHHFASFCNVRKQTPYQDYYCDLRMIEIEEMASNRLCIRLIGNRFLYKMVRNLVGTLAYIGRGKMKKEELGALLESADRTQAGITAPAHGLFLHRVDYPNLVTTHQTISPCTKQGSKQIETQESIRH
jgi:tRNA pseudouridine38-40 synthase